MTPEAALLAPVTWWQTDSSQPLHLTFPKQPADHVMTLRKSRGKPHAFQEKARKAKRKLNFIIPLFNIITFGETLSNHARMLQSRKKKKIIRTQSSVFHPNNS